MSIDLNSKEGQNKFIEDNMSNLVDGINDTYSPILVGELMNRLRQTIEEFNNELTYAFDELKVKETNRQKMYSMINEGNIPEDNTTNRGDKKSLSKWELKIKEIESQK